MDIRRRTNLDMIDSEDYISFADGSASSAGVYTSIREIILSVIRRYDSIDNGHYGESFMMPDGSIIRISMDVESRCDCDDPNIDCNCAVDEQDVSRETGVKDVS